MTHQHAEALAGLRLLRQQSRVLKVQRRCIIYPLIAIQRGTYTLLHCRWRSAWVQGVTKPLRSRTTRGQGYPFLAPCLGARSKDSDQGIDAARAKGHGLAATSGLRAWSGSYAPAGVRHVHHATCVTRAYLGGGLAGGQGADRSQVATWRLPGGRTGQVIVPWGEGWLVVREHCDRADQGSPMGMIMGGHDGRPDSACAGCAAARPAGSRQLHNATRTGPPEYRGRKKITKKYKRQDDLGARVGGHICKTRA